MAVGFPFDLFTQAFEGNWVAWATIGLGISLAGLVVLFFVLWWKMPAYAKSGLLNELFHHNPTTMECYENKRIKFHTPKLFHSGIAYDGEFFLLPKLWAKAGEELSKVNQQILNSVYTIDGSSNALYLNYAVQASVANPELAYILQHEREIQNLQDGQPVKIRKSVFQKALDHIEDDFIQLEPMFLNYPLDIPELRTKLMKALPKSIIGEIKFKIKEILMRGNQFAGLNLGMLSLLVGIITLVAVVGLHFFG